MDVSQRPYADWTEAALLERFAVLDPDQDEDEYHAVRLELIRHKGTDVSCARAVAWLRDPQPVTRRRGAHLADQLAMMRGYPYNDRLAEPLRKVAEHDPDPGPRCAALTAMAGLGLDEALPVLLAAAGHDSDDIRLAVTQAVPCLLGPEPIAEDHPAVTCLLGLTEDRVDAVRDWAVFGIGRRLAVDGPPIRDMLLRRVFDNYDPVRQEAVMGLAVRHAPQAVDCLATRLTSVDLAECDLRSAIVLRDPRLLAALLECRLVEDPRYEEALRVCSAEYHALIDDFVDAFFAAELPGLALTCELWWGDGSIDVYSETDPDRVIDVDALLERCDRNVAGAISILRTDLA